LRAGLPTTIRHRADDSRLLFQPPQGFLEALRPDLAGVLRDIELCRITNAQARRERGKLVRVWYYEYGVRAEALQ
jgi:hypothetical protein